MSWLFSRALEVAYWEANCSAGAPSALSSGNHTQLAFLPPDKMTAFSRLSRFGITFAPFEENHGEDLLTWFREDFLARTSAAPERELESPESGQECGGKWPESFAKWDRDTSSWRTHQCSLLGDLESFSGTWPRWGMMQNGECLGLSTPALPTSETGSGLWPTPRATDGDKGSRTAQGAAREWARGRNKDLGMVVALWPTPTAQDAKNNGAPSQMVRNTKPLNAEVGGALNPTWVEWLMGWPLGWTDSKPLGMDKFHQWWFSHGEH